MTRVNTKKVRNFIKNNAIFMNKAEISYSLQILNNLNYKKTNSDTMKHFRWLRNKRLQHHKKVADFSFKVFENCGAKY